MFVRNGQWFCLLCQFYAKLHSQGVPKVRQRGPEVRPFTVPPLPFYQLVSKKKGLRNWPRHFAILCIFIHLSFWLANYFSTTLLIGMAWLQTLRFSLTHWWAKLSWTAGSTNHATFTEEFPTWNYFRMPCKTIVMRVMLYRVFHSFCAFFPSVKSTLKFIPWSTSFWAPYRRRRHQWVACWNNNSIAASNVSVADF